MPPTPKATVEQNDDDGTWDIACHLINGDGVPRWTSTGWPTKAAAAMRAAEHDAEHESGDPAPELVQSAARTVA